MTLLGKWQLCNPATGLIDLTDSSGASRTLTEAGTATGGFIMLPVAGFRCGQRSALTTLASNGRLERDEDALGLLGALTFIAIASTRVAAARAMITYGVTGETEPTNALYQFGIDASLKLTYFSEFNAGEQDAAVASNIAMTRGKVHFVSGRRNPAATEVKLTIDDLTDTITGLTPPTGGTSSVFRIGNNNNLNGNWDGTLEQVRLYDTYLSDAQVADIRGEIMTCPSESEPPASDPLPTESVDVGTAIARLQEDNVLPRLLNYASARDVRELGHLVASSFRDVIAQFSRSPRLKTKVFSTRAYWPVTVSIPGLTRPPAGVIVMGAQEVKNPSAVVVAGTCHWVWSQTGGIRITAVSGLTSGTEYRLALLVVEA